MAHRKRANQAEIARILGVSHGCVSRTKHEPNCPEYDADNKAEVFATVLWWANRGRTKSAAGDDELLSGDASEGLERYRLARAQQEEIKLAELRGQVVKLSDFEEAAAAMFMPWRRVAEHFKRIDDTESFAVICEANEQVQAGLARLYRQDNESMEDE